MIGCLPVSGAQSGQTTQTAQPGAADPNRKLPLREEWRRRRDVIVSRSIADRDKTTRKSSTSPSDVPNGLSTNPNAISVIDTKAPVSNEGNQTSQLSEFDVGDSSLRATRSRISGESSADEAAPSQTAASSDNRFVKAASIVSPTSLYLVGVGDTLNVRLRGALTDSSHLSTVLPGGLLDYPSLPKPLAVAGLTTEEVAAALSAELQRQEIESSAQVAVSVSDYTSHAVIVSGSVAEPGYKILQREAVPLHVVVADSRPKPEANRVSVRSHRTGENHEFDLRDQALKQELVFPGDVISVLESAPQFYYVGGDVLQPGQKNFRQGLTLKEAVLSAGEGLGETHGISSAKKNARKPVKLVTVTRQGQDGRLKTKQYDLKAMAEDRLPDLFLQPGDRIEISK